MSENIWKFKVFVRISGVCDFERWLNSQVPEDRAKIRIFINRLLMFDSWSTTHVKPLSTHSRINELVIRGKRVQLRPLGCYGPKRKEFTLLLGAIEKNDRFVPPNAPKQADDRRKLVMLDGERYTKDYE